MSAHPAADGDDGEAKVDVGGRELGERGDGHEPEEPATSTTNNSGTPTPIMAPSLHFLVDELHLDGLAGEGAVWPVQFRLSTQ